MPNPSPLLDWSIIRLGTDVNWWVEQISDDVHWDVDGLGIIDPRQISHIIDLCEPLREYGFDPEILDSVFFKFKIDKALKENRVHLVRTKDSLIHSDEHLFALPDIMDEEKGPYADFLDQITKFRVKLLNDLIDLEHNLTIDELEEEIRERQNNDFIEGRAVHFFTEVTAILEYVPKGFELDLVDEAETAGSKSQDFEDFPDLPEAEEEKIEEDETMKWDEEHDGKVEDIDEESGEGEKADDPADESKEKPKAKRGRPRKK